MDTNTPPGLFLWQTIWHDDLQMENIYVSDEESTQIVSFIDCQFIEISPLSYLVRLVEFISIGEDPELRDEVSTSRDNIDKMDADQAIVRFKHKQTIMGKAYEAAGRFKNKNVVKFLLLPPLFRQFFPVAEKSEKRVLYFLVFV
jgi:hypothetical protein